MLNIHINAIDGCSFLPAFDLRPALIVINHLWLITVIKVLGMIVIWGCCLLTKACVSERDHGNILFIFFHLQSRSTCLA